MPSTKIPTPGCTESDKVVPMPRIEMKARVGESESILRLGVILATSRTLFACWSRSVSAVTAVTEIGTSESRSSRRRAVTMICPL